MKRTRTMNWRTRSMSKLKSILPRYLPVSPSPNSNSFEICKRRSIHCTLFSTGFLYNYDVAHPVGSPTGFEVRSSSLRMAPRSPIKFFLALLSFVLYCSLLFRLPSPCGGTRLPVVSRHVNHSSIALSHYSCCSPT